MPSERLYGGIGEKSIEYFQKVYRLFSDRTIQTLRFLRTKALTSLILRHDITHPWPHYPRTNARLPAIPCSVTFVLWSDLCSLLGLSIRSFHSFLPILFGTIH